MPEKYLIYVICCLIALFIAFKLSKKFIKFSLFIGLIFLITLYVTGCAKTNNLTSSSLEDMENTLTRIKDMPFVHKSKINIEKSLVMGEGQTWSGQLLVLVPAKKREVFNFYVNNLQDYGWKEQTTIRGETSILNYLGENNRVAIIAITERSFNRSEILISVSPYTEEFQKKIGEIINEKYLEITDD